jgi:epoxyqueuosine reductase
MFDRDGFMEFARQAGADVIGVADIGRFDELPEEKHPRVIFPEAQSAIVLGRRIPRGALRGVEEGTNFLDYSLYGSEWLDNRFLPMLTFQVAEALESDGWEAVPLPNLPPEVPPMGVSVGEGKPAPNVMLDLDDAAVRAGAGEIGYCGVLLTPGFGPRQRIHMILTDAPIAPDPILEEPICPRSDECTGHCPLGAFGGETERVIAGKRMTVASVDRSICASCKNGARPNPAHPAGRPDRMAAYCIRSCVDFLERSGRVSGRLAEPFRKREPWVVKTEADFYKVR